MLAFTGGASGAPAPAGGVAPVAFTERRGEDTPPCEGYHRICCVHRAGGQSRPPLRSFAVLSVRGGVRAPRPTKGITKLCVGAGFYPARRIPEVSAFMGWEGYPKGTRSAALHSARPVPAHFYRSFPFSP